MNLIKSSWGALLHTTPLSLFAGYSGQEYMWTWVNTLHYGCILWPWAAYYTDTVSVFLCGCILWPWAAYYTDTVSVFPYGSIIWPWAAYYTDTVSSILHRYRQCVSLRKHKMTLTHVPYRFRSVCFIAPRINMAAYNPKSIIPHLYSGQEASLDHCPISYFDYIPGWQQSFITRSLQIVNSKSKTHLPTSTLHSSCSWYVSAKSGPRP